MYGGKKKMMKAGGAKPDYLDMDKDGNKTEPMKNAVKDKAKAKGKKKPINIKSPADAITANKPYLKAKNGGERRMMMKKLKEDQKEMRKGMKEARKEQRGQNREERKDIRAEKRSERTFKRAEKKATRKAGAAKRKVLAANQATAQGKLKKAARKMRKATKKANQSERAMLMKNGGKKKMGMGGKKMMYQMGGFIEPGVFDLDRD